MNSGDANNRTCTKVLLLSAYTLSRARLGQQIRDIEEAIHRSKHRDCFQVAVRSAVRPKDIQRAIAEERPTIVHFCGHCTKDGYIALEDEVGNPHPVTPQALANLFGLYTTVRCVVLNARFSSRSAEAISEYIDCAIGMNSEIQDSCAIAFAEFFYGGLGQRQFKYVRDLERSFEEGKVAYALATSDVVSADIPIFYKNNTPKNKRAKTLRFIQTPLPGTQSSPAINELSQRLKEGDWKAADVATRNILLSHAGIDATAWGSLKTRDINSFPCELLETVDQLWAQNSDGRFGLRAQKRVWHSSRENNLQFSQQIGWCVVKTISKRSLLPWGQATLEKEVAWRSYDRLIFSLNAPEGHLPCCVEQGIWKSAIGKFSSVAKKLEACSLT